MTLIEIRAWITDHPKASCVSSIQSEIMLIEYYEKQKHDPFSSTEIKKTWNEWIQMADPVSVERIALKIRIIGLTQGVSISKGDTSSDLFFKVLASDVKHIFMARHNNSSSHFVHGDGICDHDKEMDSKILLAMEYVINLIKRHG